MWTIELYFEKRLRRSAWSPDCELDFHAACASSTVIAANLLLIAPAAELNSGHSFAMQRG